VTEEMQSLAATFYYKVLRTICEKERDRHALPPSLTATDRFSVQGLRWVFGS
jgi:hypothetical protein